jgi:hypothetical protein
VKRKQGWLQRHEKFLKDKTELMMPAPRGALRDPEPVHVFICGRELCRDGQPHSWDGEGIECEMGGGGFMSSATCSKCGLAAIDHDLMCGP